MRPFGPWLTNIVFFVLRFIAVNFGNCLFNQLFLIKLQKKKKLFRHRKSLPQYLIIYTYIDSTVGLSACLPLTTKIACNIMGVLTAYFPPFISIFHKVLLS